MGVRRPSKAAAFAFSTLAGALVASSAQAVIGLNLTNYSVSGVYALDALNGTSAGI